MHRRRPRARSLLAAPTGVLLGGASLAAVPAAAAPAADDPDPVRSLKDGYLGVRNHGPDDQTAFRNIQIKELPARTC